MAITNSTIGFAFITLMLVLLIELTGFFTLGESVLAYATGEGAHYAISGIGLTMIAVGREGMALKPHAQASVFHRAGACCFSAATCDKRPGTGGTGYEQQESRPQRSTRNVSDGRETHQSRFYCTGTEKRRPQ
jgi:hypothetical protein